MSKAKSLIVLGITGLALLLSAWTFHNICAEISVLNIPFIKKSTKAD